MFKDLLRSDRFPTGWCPGCGIGQMLIQLAMVMDEASLDYTNSTVISGVGCTGRLSSYMNLDGIYTLHGRTIPVAEAIKLVNPNLKVIVASGDGDLTGIGGNHLVHAVRRNTDVAVLCNNNNVFGLTGGQAGPTTPRDTRTLSTPAGAAYDPINLQNVVKSGAKHFYARTTVYHQKHLRKCIQEAIAWPGFAFVEVACHCIENNGRRLGFNSAYEMLQHFRRTYKLAPDGADTLGPSEIGIIRQI
jgi:2-oxoglutarate ferredoxin oxidoreductase subunit beta